MRKLEIAAVVAIFLFIAGVVMAQPSPSPCGAGTKCTVATLRQTKANTVGVILAVDSGIQFGDGTVQWTAGTGFSGSATSFTATAASGASAFISNQGATWCFDPGCTNMIGADAGPSGRKSGLYFQAMNDDANGSDGVFYFNYPNGTLNNSKLLEVAKNGSVKLDLDGNGALEITGNFVLLSGSTSYKGPPGAAFLAAGSEGSPGTAWSVKTDRTYANPLSALMEWDNNAVRTAYVNINGDFFAGIDGGNTTGSPLVEAASQTLAQVVEYGADAGATGVLSVTFPVAHSVAPQSCHCSIETGAIGCTVTSRTTTGAQCTCTTGGSAIIDWVCFGTK